MIVTVVEIDSTRPGSVIIYSILEYCFISTDFGSACIITI